MLKTSNKFIALFLIIIITVSSYNFYERSKVKIKDVIRGAGPEVKKGQAVVFDYRAFIFDEKASKHLGKEFDSSYSHDEPMRAVIGAKQVIPGLEKALIGMRVGGHREAIIAASMGYGEARASENPVPANSKLIYIIELREIE